MCSTPPNPKAIAKRLRRASALLLAAGTLTAGVLATPAWAPQGCASCLHQAPPAAARAR
jgi:hypothetical protein